MTLFPWQVTVDGRLLPMVFRIEADSAEEARSMLEAECRMAYDEESDVSIHVWSVVPLLQQVEDSETCPGGDPQAGLPPPDSGSAPWAY